MCACVCVCVYVYACTDWHCATCPIPVLEAGTDVQPVIPQPNIVSQFIVVATSQLHKTFYQQGALRQSLVEGWLTAIKEADYYNVIEAHEGESEFWDSIDMTSHFGNVHWPAVHVGYVRCIGCD